MLLVSATIWLYLVCYSYGTVNITTKSRQLALKKDWITRENVQTVNGKIPTTSCPLGFFRPSHYPQFKISSPRADGCRPCLRGHYANTTGVIGKPLGPGCTACPAGKYGDRTGLKSVLECSLCPPGKYGYYTGSKSRLCSGSCPKGTYSDVYGLVSYKDCKVCPVGYIGWQCNSPLIPATDIK